MPLLAPNITHKSHETSFFVPNPPVNLSMQGDLTVGGLTTLSSLVVHHNISTDTLSVGSTIKLGDTYPIGNVQPSTTIHYGTARTDRSGLCIITLPFRCIGHYSVMISYQNMFSVIVPAYVILSANTFMIQGDAYKLINWTAIGIKE
jgi:hypothetical protein